MAEIADVSLVCRNKTKELVPIGSMYAIYIYGNIYHQYTPNVSICTSTMDPMGYGKISTPSTATCSFGMVEPSPGFCKFC